MTISAISVQSFKRNKDIEEDVAKKKLEWGG